jgi:hypothetical protein
VSIKIPATSKRIMPVVPEMWFEKYKPVIMIATSILITLSTEPMLFFIAFLFLVVEQNYNAGKQLLVIKVT